MAAWDSVNGAATADAATPTVPGGSNRIGLFSLSFEFTAAPTSVTATLDGETLTPIASSASGDSGGFEQAEYTFYADEALLATIGTGAKALVFSITGGAGHQGFSSKSQFIVDAAQSAPVGTTGGATGGGTASATVNPAGANAVVVAFVSSNNAGGTSTAGSGYTLDYDAASAGGDGRGITQHQDDPATGSQACDLTLPSSTRWAMVAVVVENAAGAAPRAQRLLLLGVG